MKAKLKLFFSRLNRMTGKPTISKIMFIALGISSTIWFLIRVIPKPQRASYPCMKAAAPLMSTFVIYLLTFSGSVLALQKAKIHFKRNRYIYAAIFFIISASCALLFVSNKTEEAYASTIDTISVLPNSPIGVEHGIFPGRVVCVFNPKVATLD